MAATTTRRTLPTPADVQAALETVDASIGRTAARIQVTEATLEKHRHQYADLVALRSLLERMR